jgi:hypothetical protein
VREEAQLIPAPYASPNGIAEELFCTGPVVSMEILENVCSVIQRAIAQKRSVGSITVQPLTVKGDHNNQVVYTLRDKIQEFYRLPGMRAITPAAREQPFFPMVVK